MIENLFWVWFIIAAFLILLEVTMPIYYFLWVGLTASVVGLLSWLFPALDLTWQLALFSILSMISIAVGRAYLKSSAKEEVEATLNRRAEQFIGRTFELDEPIVNGHAMQKIDGLFWKVNGPESPAGSTVKVVSVRQKSILVVELNK